MSAQVDSLVYTLERKPEDELWHEPSTDDPMWRESYYFDFIDPASDLAYFSTLGYRRNKGHMGYTAAYVWEGDVYYRKEYGYPTENGAIQVEGLVYEPVELNEQWRVRHFETINKVPTDSDAFHGSPSEFPLAEEPLFTLDMDVACDAIHDPVYYEPDEKEASVVSNLYDEHADQGLTVEGEVTIGDETITVDGMGERDHSWGIRDWRGVDSWRWISCLFDEDSAMQFWRATKGSDTAVEGYLLLDGQTSLIETVDLDTTFQDDGVSQADLTISITDREGRTLELTGDPDVIVPIDFEWEDERATIRRSPTRFSSPQFDDAGHGWSEYMTVYES